MVFALPGDPIRALGGDRPISEAVQAQLRDEYNLDDPLLVQYGKYVAGLAQGDLGTDFSGRPVADIEQGHISTASCILANLSMKLGRSLKWDAEKHQVVDDAEANKLLKRPYRAGYEHPAG